MNNSANETFSTKNYEHIRKKYHTPWLGPDFKQAK